MKSTSPFFELEDEMYLESVTQWASQPVPCIRQVYRLATSLTVTCLQQQLQSHIGRGLVPRILEKHAQRATDFPNFSLANTGDFSILATEGNRLLSTILPGKKSAIMGIIVHYTKLSFGDIDPILGLCAYSLFTRLASDLVNHEETTSLILGRNELEEFAPELNGKDYIAIGAYSAVY